MAFLWSLLVNPRHSNMLKWSLKPLYFFLPKVSALYILIFENIWNAGIRKKQWICLKFWVRRLFNVCVRVFCAPNATILLVYIPAKIKISFIWKDHFLLSKSPSSVTRSVAIFPSIIQAFTQPYSFGGRRKLIIYQIRHELSITIYEISTSWKKR